MTERKAHIDIAKGISIILVALFHSKLKLFAPHLIDSMGLFRMPLFFLLSGVVFNTSRPFRELVVRKADSLLKPYFSTLIALAVFGALYGEDSDFAWKIKGMLYGNGATIEWLPMWFLTHLFAVSCFVCILLKITRAHNRILAYKVMVVSILIVVGAICIDLFSSVRIQLFGKDVMLPGLPFSFDLIFLTSAFFVAGIFLRQIIADFRPSTVMFIGAFISLLAIITLTDARLGLNSRILVAPPAVFVGAVCGIYVVLSISIYLRQIDYIGDVFISLGQASLYILIFHAFVGGVVYNYLSPVVEEGQMLTLAIVSFISSVTMPLAIKQFVIRNRYLSLIYEPVGRSQSAYQVS